MLIYLLPKPCWRRWSYFCQLPNVYFGLVYCATTSGEESVLTFFQGKSKILSQR